MQTNKEALLALFRGEKADFIPALGRCLKDVVFPGERYIELGDKFDPHGTGPDAWGVMWTNQGPSPAIDGSTVAKDFKLFDNMDEWRDHIKFPPIDFMPLENIFQAMCKGMGVDKENHVVGCLLLSGQFERMNQLIGMENALCAFYEYPDEVHEFFDAICEYKLKCIDLAYKYLKPDVIHMHDDWGTNDNMFFSPELWREFIKPNEIRYANRIHELGMLYNHHSCGYIQQIFPDLVEIGIDCINPVNVSNDIEYLMDNFSDRITIVGGCDNQRIEHPDATDDDVRNEVRNCIDKYAKRGRYIPHYIPTNARVYGVFMDELEGYGKTAFQD